MPRELQVGALSHLNYFLLSNSAVRYLFSIAWHDLLQWRCCATIYSDDMQSTGEDQRTRSLSKQ